MLQYHSGLCRRFQVERYMGCTYLYRRCQQKRTGGDVGIISWRIKERRISYRFRLSRSWMWFFSDFSTPESRTLFTELVPHIQSVAVQIPPDTQTEEIVNLYIFLGYGYNEFADYSQALEWYQKALAIVEQVLGVSHPSTAVT